MSTVDVAADYANRMIEREGAGGTEAAMRRIEARHGIGYWTLWNLRYRRREMKTIAADQFARIRAAYLATCERQLRALESEIAIEKARSGDDLFEDLASEIEVLATKVRSARASR